mmetsp:Transcript_29173/g.74130  ORF Transcript_29173/g.74130 Transcript_29173/m.74130 type:complete len:424 (+) Transcript_29173:7-1278(+)
MWVSSSKKSCKRRMLGCLMAHCSLTSRCTCLAMLRISSGCFSMTFSAIVAPLRRSRRRRTSATEPSPRAPSSTSSKLHSRPGGSLAGILVRLPELAASAACARCACCACSRPAAGNATASDSPASMRSCRPCSSRWRSRSSRCLRRPVMSPVMPAAAAAAAPSTGSVALLSMPAPSAACREPSVASSWVAKAPLGCGAATRCCRRCPGDKGAGESGACCGAGAAASTEMLGEASEGGFEGTGESVRLAPIAASSGDIGVTFVTATGDTGGGAPAAASAGDTAPDETMVASFTTSAPETSTGHDKALRTPLEVLASAAPLANVSPEATKPWAWGGKEASRAVGWSRGAFPMPAAAFGRWLVAIRLWRLWSWSSSCFLWRSAMSSESLTFSICASSIDVPRSPIAAHARRSSGPVCWARANGDTP